MKNYKKITETKLVVSSIICDCCGQVIHEDDHIEIDKTFGYESNHDNDRWQLDLCSSCLEKAFPNIRKS